MQAKHIIGVFGNRSHGKGAIADAIRHHKRDVGFVGFSDDLKEGCAQLFGIPNDILWGVSARREELIQIDWPTTKARFEKLAPRWVPKVLAVAHYIPEKFQEPLDRLRKWIDVLEKDSETAPLTTRRILQTIGTEWGRAERQDIWVEGMMRTANRLLRIPDIKVVVGTDGRFVSEAKHLRGLGHEVWRVDARKRLGESTSTHSSELDVWSPEMTQYVTAEITNDGTESELYQLVERELRRLG